MIQHKDADKPVELHGFLVGAELIPGGPTPEEVSLRLVDSLAFMEGIGKTDCEHLGLVQLVDVDEKGEPIVTQ